MYALPAESETVFIVAPPLLHTPVSTTSRLPEPIAARGANATLETPLWWVETCCTKLGVSVPGVTAFDAAEADPVPTEFVALTVNV